jgi:hypothetical protein
LGGVSLAGGENWQRLETITKLLLSATDVEVTGCKKSMKIKKANVVIKQETTFSNGISTGGTSKFLVA